MSKLKLNEMAIDTKKNVSWISHPGLGHAIYRDNSPTHTGFLTHADAAKEFKKQVSISDEDSDIDEHLSDMKESHLSEFSVKTEKTGMLQHKVTVCDLKDNVIFESFAITNNAAEILGNNEIKRLEENVKRKQIVTESVLDIAKRIATKA